MTKEEALKRLSNLVCPYTNARMTDCPHCALEVKSLVISMTRKEDYESKQD